MKSTSQVEMQTIGLGAPTSGLERQSTYNNLDAQWFQAALECLSTSSSSSSSSGGCPPYKGNGVRWESDLQQACPYTGVSTSSSSAGEGFTVKDGGCTIFFNPDASASCSAGSWTTYKALYGADTIYSAYHDPIEHELVVVRRTDSGSAVIRLYDFSTSTPGAIKSMTEPSGIPIDVTDDGRGQVGSVQRTVTANGQTTVWAVDYIYENDRLMTATLTMQVDGGAVVNVRRLVYTYTPQDLLETVTRQEYVSGNWQDIARSYYRYYPCVPGGELMAGPFSAGSGALPYVLPYAVGPEAFAEMVEDGLDPLTATDEQLSACTD